MSVVAVENIAGQLSEMFGLPLLGATEHFDGAEWQVLRPQEPTDPSGFAIVIQPTIFSVEVLFLPDTFAGHMVREMGEASDEEIDNFDKKRSAYESRGTRIEFAVNDDPVQTLAQLSKNMVWQRIHLSCSVRSPINKKPGVEEVNESVLDLSKICLDLVLQLLPVAVEDPLLPYLGDLAEGTRLRVEVNRYVRLPRNRIACLNAHGYICKVCGMDFEKQYGEIGESFIEVHHILPLSQITDSYVLDPVKDLIPLCCNCHSMAHRGRLEQPPRSVEELKSLMLKQLPT